MISSKNCKRLQKFICLLNFVEICMIPCDFAGFSLTVVLLRIDTNHNAYETGRVENVCREEAVLGDGIGVNC